MGIEWGMGIESRMGIYKYIYLYRVEDGYGSSCGLQ